MKYRRLRPDELEGLEKEFVQFLAANTVTANDWEQLKAKKPGRAEELIGLFSDIVFDKVLSKATYLEYKTPNDIKTFCFEENRIVMNGLFVEGATGGLDFTQSQQPVEMLHELRQQGARLKLYTAEKAYRTSKELEAFQMMENGALISKDGALFKLLERMKGGG